MEIIIEQGKMEDCAYLTEQIPEFSENPYNLEIFKQRLEGKFSLILVAKIEKKASRL